MLTQPPSNVFMSSASQHDGQPPDDVSGRAHRQAIGYFGLALPVLLVLIAGYRPESAEPWKIRDSVSAYYYSGAVAVFVGLLVALALFLITYRGYRNKYQWADRTAGVIAGAAAFGVAFFPTAAPSAAASASWWRPVTGVAHYVSAAVLFTMFAVFSLWLFRLPPGGEGPPQDKRLKHDKDWRNQFYLVCGLVIVAGMGWTGVAGQLGRPIFLPESIALVAFALSWLAKGRAHRTLAQAPRAIVAKARAMSVSATTP